MRKKAKFGWEAVDFLERCFAKDSENNRLSAEKLLEVCIQHYLPLGISSYALSDGTPLVVFSGQVPTLAIGTDAFQEADVVGISRACTKWNVMVKDVAELPRRITEAFEIATTGRPGPVLVDLPKDITAGILKKPVPRKYTIPSRAFSNILSSDNGDVTLDPNIIQAAEIINKAKRPVIYAGQGVLSSESPILLRELAKLGNIPVTTTLQGLGAFDELDNCSLYMLGMHGSAYANLAMQNADAIIALGARFDDRVTGHLAHFAPAAKQAAKEGRGGIVHFEISLKNINKVVQATAAVAGDVTENLAKFLRRTLCVASVRDNKKLITRESGTKIPATYKSGRFKEWQKQDKISIPATDPLSINYKKKKKNVAEDGYWEYIGKVTVDKFKTELKTIDQISKERRMKAKRKAKNARLPRKLRKK
ncbi:3045_t:CDS:2 [Paraglomus occultum]|uniref:acetolactate synthase n=1 Tax=Paraglomus occultum TaxID=144539 RepID=A0A9N9D8M8_9GLOM|nr:3045_t:CDS:2 [Paraglomus occultum]